MRILIAAIFAFWAVLILPALPSAAENEPDYASAALYEAIDPSQIILPDEAAGFFRENGISQEDPQSVSNLSPEKTLSGIWDTVKQEAAAPLTVCSALLSLVMLSAVLQGTGDAVSDGNMRRITEMVFTLVSIGCAAKPLCQCLTRAADALQDGCVFMAGYVPVFSALLAAGGAVGSATTYQIFVFFLTELETQLTGSLLFPLLRMATAIGIADAVNPTLKLGSLVSGVRTFLKWALGFMMSVFSALLSVRSFVAASADSLASRTLKLVTSGFIPIVGGAVSESLGTVQGSLVLLRNGTGAVGILALLWMTLPPITSLLLYRIVFSIAGTAAAMTGAETLEKLFHNAHAVLSAAFAMLVCFSVMLVFSTAIMVILIRGE